jgi:transposase-like protein
MYIITMATPVASKKRKLNVKSIEEKYLAIKAVEAGQKKKIQIAKDFGVPPNTLSTWLKSKDNIIQAYETSAFGPATKKMRTADFPDVEKALDLWFRDARSNNVPVSGPILKSRAEDLAKQLGHSDFACSS